MLIQQWDARRGPQRGPLGRTPRGRSAPDVLEDVKVLVAVAGEHVFAIALLRYLHAAKVEAPFVLDHESRIWCPPGYLSTTLRSHAESK